VLVLAASVFFISRATIDSESIETSSDSDVVTVHTSSMWDPVFFFVMLVPIVLALVPLLLRGRSWPVWSIVCTVLLGVFAIVGSLSLGLFFIPGFVVALVALFLRPRRRMPRD